MERPRKWNNLFNSKYGYYLNKRNIMPILTANNAQFLLDLVITMLWSLVENMDTDTVNDLGDGHLHFDDEHITPMDMSFYDFITTWSRDMYDNLKVGRPYSITFDDFDDETCEVRS